jgi:hypothetical protein
MLTVGVPLEEQMSQHNAFEVLPVTHFADRGSPSNWPPRQGFNSVDL